MYSLYIGMISRSGSNTVNSLAYRAGIKLVDEKTGETYDHRNKMVQDVQLILPDNAPEWAKELQALIKEDRGAGVKKFCDIVEGAEKRKDSQLYREFRVSLPREFTKQQNKDLVQEFVKDQLCSLGTGALLNYHFDKNDITGETNPHCHILALTRGLDEKGLSEKKPTEWNKKALHEQWRVQWASYGNFHLQKNGFAATWDHRSYIERGINLEPQPKFGKNIQEIEARRGCNPKDVHSRTSTDQGKSYQEVKLRNLYRIISRPEIILDLVSSKQTTFMWGDVAKSLARYVDDQALFNRLSEKLKSSKELVCLENSGTFSSHVFTTREKLSEEKNFVERVGRLQSVSSHSIDLGLVDAAIELSNSALKTTLKDKKACLSDDQIKAIHHMSSSSQLSFVEGYAGAGKTTVMRVMREIWEESGYNVYGLAPTGRAADNLSGCGISSMTVYKFLWGYEKGKNQFDAKSVLVLDEAGMVDSERFSKLAIAVENLGVKLVATGDRGQLSPVEAGIPFRLGIEVADKAELTTIIRQKEDWQKAATVLFGKGKAQEALKEYGSRGCITTVHEDRPSLDNLIAQKNHKGVVGFYNLTRRISGNISHEIRSDLDKGNGQFAHHKDYTTFCSWKGKRDAVVKEIYNNIETYKPFMKELGVDGLDFAKKALKEHGNDARAWQLATKLGINWRIKVTHTCDLRVKTKKQIVDCWFKSTQEHKGDVQAIMAHSNNDVKSLNTLARHLKKESGEIGKEEFRYSIERIDGEELGKQIIVREERQFSKGDQILFTKK